VRLHTPAPTTSWRDALAGAALLTFLIWVLLLRPHAAAGAPAEPAGGSVLPGATDVLTITGRIRDSQDAPVGAAQVFAFRGATQIATNSDSQGRYTLTLPGGVYNIVFNPPFGSGLASQVQRQIQHSQVLDVHLAPGHAIKGTVFRSAAPGTPVPNVAIFAFSRRTFQGFGLPPSAQDGTYQIALEDGDWDLTFTPPPFTGLGPTQTTVLSLSADVQRDIFLPAGFTLYGRMTAASSAGPVGVPEVEIFAGDPGQALSFGFAPTDATGGYTGTLPTGRYDVAILAPPFQKLGSTVITDVVGPPDRRRNVALPPGYTLSGSVRCGGGLANAFVLAVPQPPLSSGRLEGWGRFAGADGRYALALQPGAYTLVVTPPRSSGLPARTLQGLTLQSDRLLNVDLCVLLPLVRR
jgi:hypothetical protein